MDDNELKKISEEIHEKDRIEIEQKNKSEKSKGTSLLCLLLGGIIFFGSLFAGEGVPILGGIVFLAILIWFLRAHNVI